MSTHDSKTSIGIDLGTTYSVIAYVNDVGRPETIPNREGDLLTPSVVLFDGDEVIVGRENMVVARNSLEAAEKDLVLTQGDAERIQQN